MTFRALQDCFSRLRLREVAPGGRELRGRPGARGQRRVEGEERFRVLFEHLGLEHLVVRVARRPRQLEAVPLRVREILPSEVTTPRGNLLRLPPDLHEHRIDANLADVSVHHAHAHERVPGLGEQAMLVIKHILHQGPMALRRNLFDFITYRNQAVRMIMNASLAVEGGLLFGFQEDLLGIAVVPVNGPQSQQAVDRAFLMHWLAGLIPGLLDEA